LQLLLQRAVHRGGHHAHVRVAEGPALGGRARGHVDRLPRARADGERSQDDEDDEGTPTRLRMHGDPPTCYGFDVRDLNPLATSDLAARRVAPATLRSIWRASSEKLPSTAPELASTNVISRL